VHYFGSDNHIIVLSRQSVNTRNNAYSPTLLLPKDGYDVTYRRWDGRHVEKHWATELEGADLLINLAGRTVNCRYTAKNKKEIFDSRTGTTTALGEAIRGCAVPPKCWINAASATIYRDASDRPQDEYTGEMHNDFSVQVCKAWEKTFYEQATPYTRKAVLRMAITLSNGGVLVPYFRLLKFKLGGRQGSGKQMYSWVHAEDVCRVMEWLYEHPGCEGTYNCSSPYPVTNEYFMKALRSAAGHRTGLPAPAWLLAIGAKLIGTEPELLLKSRWVVPTRLKQAGFVFKYPKLKDALQSIIAQTPREQYHLW
jgi:uncharacterized protein (TIGR01777 family)